MSSECQVFTDSRIDCFPNIQIDRDGKLEFSWLKCYRQVPVGCTAAGCCWKAVSDLGPKCFQPLDYNTYTVTEEDQNHVEATLSNQGHWEQPLSKVCGTQSKTKDTKFA